MKILKLLSLFFILTILGCTDKTDTPFIAYNEVTENTMLTVNNELIFVSAYPDSLLRKKSDLALISGEIYNISPNYQVLDYGHVWSEEKDGIIDSTPSIEEGALHFSYGESNDNYKFTSELQNLSPLTDYYVRSYVKILDQSRKSIYAYNPVTLHFKTPDIQDKWEIIKSNFPGKPRMDAISFVIKDKAYVGLGFDGAFALGDIWQFNYNDLTWSPITPFPGDYRYGAVAFVINNIAYVGLGENYTDKYLTDFWAYDPSKGSDGKWSQIASLPGFGRKNAVAFAVNGIAYIATGQKEGILLADVWKYNPETNLWKNINKDLSPVLQRERAVSFVIKNYAYVGFGNRDTTELSDFYRFDVNYETWSSDIPIFEGGARTGAMAFATSDGFYIGGGKKDTSYLRDFWYFDPYNSKWEGKTILGDSTVGGFYGGVGFFIGEYGFIGLGQTKTKKINHFWQYLP